MNFDHSSSTRPKIQPLTGDRLLNPAEVSELVGLSVSTLAKLRCQGGGPPYVQPTRRIKYWETEVIAWVNRRRRNSTSEPATIPMPRRTSSVGS
jgi:predicted DNA-binding transcriptional regulator AlpA